MVPEQRDDAGVNPSSQSNPEHSPRQHYRAPTTMSARYQVVAEPHPPPEPTVVIDLTLGGCAMRSAAAIAAGTPIEVLLASSPNESPTRFPGRVQNCRSADGGYVLGVAFDELDSQQRPVLTRLLGTDVFRQDAPDHG